ncbi:hypothetical protein IW140_004396 [Coemansia sp. RSA 1813]|nr:hypothetical protein EV178_004482 [Coemansia sp. RSA 1646]KAJ1769438.1 hypothetical protein LPJ74_004044 [Coemansia sp. RSA 1843]KAJ2086279.1 hypothetical protein IW138_005803 [Coemansia sp. RSA 986]KAJ2212931.1 hypothetical protein EV179_004242 [Coemansia sp. RSA 487]KAJ2567606.1 hypothetical protein IW140_004396 [Coemansia sp. RSA 1813]
MDTNEWDSNALRELAETGRVASALPSSLSSSSNKTRQINNNDSDDSVASSKGRRFTLHFLQQGTSQSMASVEEAIDETQKTKSSFWLDTTDPTVEDMDLLARAFGIHPLTVEDILADAGDTDKLEAVDDYAMLVYRTTADEEGDMGFSVVLKQGYVLSFHSASALAHVHGALDRLASHETSTVYVVYALVDDITDSLGLVMRTIEREVSKVDELVMALASSNDKGATLQRIGLLRRRILSIWRLLLGKPDIVRALTRLFAQSHEDIEHYLQDICDHLATLTSACAHSEMVLSRAHANYMARLSLDLSGASVDVGLFSNRWLVLVGIMLPLQVSVSYFGQNVKVPWETDPDAGLHVNLYAWYGIFGMVAGMFVVAVGLARLKQML